MLPTFADARLREESSCLMRLARRSSDTSWLPIARIVPIEEDAEDFKVLEPGKPIGELGSVRAVRLRKQVEVNRVLRESRGRR